MNTCVVDTNVPKIANLLTGVDEIADCRLAMVSACVDKIQEITSFKRKLVIDDGMEIFNEYRGQLCMSGQPGVGDAFMKWVHDYAWGDAVDRVPITKVNDTYAEFPVAEALSGFDKSDRKFVATAVAHPGKPTIVVSEDRGWHRHRVALESEGITIEFL